MICVNGLRTRNLLISHSRLISSSSSSSSSNSPSPATTDPTAECPLTLKYYTLIKTNVLKPDPIQVKALAQLSSLHLQLASTIKLTPSSLPKGVYLHGGTGSGKTFLMDLFYETAPTVKKRRCTLSAFMIEIHDRLSIEKKKRDALIKSGFLKRILPKLHDDIGGTANNDDVTSFSFFGARIVLNSGGGDYFAFDKQTKDPLPIIAREIIGESFLLCLDEFEVTDVADAFIITRLFESLFAEGIILVATSNRSPKDLYANGLNRESFFKTIKAIEERCDVISLEKSTNDYRAKKIRSNQSRRYAFDIDYQVRDKLVEALYSTKLSTLDTASLDHYEPYTVTRSTRKITVPRVSSDKSVAYFSFFNLTHENPYGTADYAILTQEFDSIFVTDIPNLNTGGCTIDGLRRFVLFIDAAYDSKVELFLSSTHDIDQLWNKSEDIVFGSGSINQDDVLGTDAKLVPVDSHTVFSLDRSISRLYEMVSDDYIVESNKAMILRRKKLVGKKS